MVEACVENPAPKFAYTVEWAEFARLHLLYPLVFQIIVTCVLVALHLHINTLRQRKGSSYLRFYMLFIGTDGILSHRNFNVIAGMLNWAFSVTSCLIFVVRTYNQKVMLADHIVESVFSVFYAVVYWCELVQADFRPSSAWATGAVIDVFTIVPVVGSWMFSDWQDRWLTLLYLRAIRALQAYMGFTHSAVTNAAYSQRLRWGIVLIGMKITTLVFSFAGTILIVEILGELPYLADKTISTGMGDVSFIQMAYWIVTTVTTVGYGDFSPTTIVSRMITITFIIGGGLFFVEETNQLMSVLNENRDATDHFVQSDAGSTHIVIVGRTVGISDPITESLLHQTLDPIQAKVPSVVILSEIPFEPGLKHFVQTSLPPPVRNKVWLLQGSAMQAEDLDRVDITHCSMAFILPDEMAPDGNAAEDSRNILRTLALHLHNPNLQLRLVLLEPESKAQAMSMGIPHFFIIAIRELKCQLFVLSARVKGVMPFLAGLLQMMTDLDVETFVHAASTRAEPWKVEYGWGLRWTLYAFVINEYFVGWDYHKAVAHIYEASEGSVLLVAVQHHGKLLLNFDGTVSPSQVVVVIANSLSDCRDFADSHQFWRSLFLTQRYNHDKTSTSQETYNLKGMTRHSSTGHSPEAVVPAAPSAAAGVQAGRIESLEELQASKSLFLLLVADRCKDERSSGSWQQVVAILRALRQPHLPAFQPVIVLSFLDPDQEIVRTFEHLRVAFWVVPLQRVESLVHAGLPLAQTVAVLHGVYGRGHFCDNEVIILSNIIERMLDQRADTDAFTLYALSQTSSVQLTNVKFDVSGTNASGAKVTVGEFPDAKKRNSPAHHVRQLCHDGLALWKTISMDYNDQYTIAAKQLMFNKQFIAGQVLTPDFFGSMLGHMFHFPFTNEFLEAFAMPGRRGQMSFPWQVQCPDEWVGQQCGELTHAWILMSDEKLHGCGSVLVLAIYRHGGENDDVGGAQRCKQAGYNITLPRRRTILRRSDQLTVLASSQFAKVMAERRLLRGAEDGVQPVRVVPQEGESQPRGAEDGVQPVRVVQQEGESQPRNETPRTQAAVRTSNKIQVEVAC